MTHLNDVIEQAESGEMMTYSGMATSKETPSEMVDKAAALMPHAMCFDIGNEYGVVGLQSIPGMFLLPYQTCWFELAPTTLTDDLAHIGMLAHLQEDKEVTIYFFKRGRSRQDPWWFIGFARNCVETDFPEGRGISGHFWPTAAGGLQNLVALLWAYLSAMNCVNVSKVETRADEKVQKARLRRGKRPLFSFWTLSIDLDRGPANNNSSGGSHASPRLHLRRGHARQFSPGRWTWVNAHAVGNKESGMVHKSYKSRPCESAGEAKNSSNTIANYDHSALGMRQFESKTTAGATP